MKVINISKKFDRMAIHNFVKVLKKQGYPLVINEWDDLIFITVNTNGKLNRIEIERDGEKYSLLETGIVQDQALYEIVDAFLNDSTVLNLDELFNDNSVEVEIILLKMELDWKLDELNHKIKTNQDIAEIKRELGDLTKQIANLER